MRALPALVLVTLVAAACGGGDGGGTGTPTVDTVVVSPANPSVVAGNTVQLSAQARDASGGVISGRTFAWQSLNTNVASVNATSGLVTTLAAGTATIKATTGTVAGQTTVTVTSPPQAASVTLAPTAPDTLFAAGATVQLTATVRDANNNVMTGVPLTWGSNNTNVATVSTSGLVTSQAVGNTAQSATISVTVTGQPAVTASVPVRVRQKLVSVAAPPKPLTLYTNDTQQLAVVARDANGTAITGLAGFTFGTTDAGVATVSPTGLITATGAGTAKVGVGLTGDGATQVDTVAITVNTATATASVTTPGLSFSPQTVHVTKGGTVSWTMSGIHNVTWDNPPATVANSPTCNTGNCLYDITMPNISGTYNYHCSVHGAGMNGTVVVH